MEHSYGEWRKCREGEKEKGVGRGGTEALRGREGDRGIRRERERMRGKGHMLREREGERLGGGKGGKKGAHSISKMESIQLNRSVPI